MASILDTLQQHLGGGITEQIGRQIGTDRGTAQTALSVALPLLIGALARNTATEGGAATLHRALSDKHDGSILERLAGALGQPEERQDGLNILKHVFGNGQDRVQRGLSRTSGLDVSQAGSLLAMLAPIVLGAIGRTQRERGLDHSSLGNLLGQERLELEQQAPREVGLLEQLLDADKDGDVDLEDLKQKGLGGLGNLFGR